MAEAVVTMLPDRLMAYCQLGREHTEFLAHEATRLARQLAPKMSGKMSTDLRPCWADGFFGVQWSEKHTWYQEAGIRPFTMKSLAGKTIPMWVNDFDGSEARKNPKAQTRMTMDGRQQVLIFRKAAPIGSRKKVIREGQTVEVPRSYPGAPGRISQREAPMPWTAPGRVGGRIARHNVGVRWRHPGLSRRGFIRQAIEAAAEYHNVNVESVRDQWGRWR